MVQAVWFDAGAARSGRLWLTIHHLAVDGVSWRILVPDLAAAWQAIAAGQAVALPARGTSFRRWAERLAAQARDGRVVEELSFWSGDAGRAVAAAGARTGSMRCATRRHGRASDADAAGGGDGGAADAGAGGVPWRHQRRAADRACACGGGLVPAAWAPAVARARRCCSTSKAMAARSCWAARSFCRCPRREVPGDVDLTRTVGWFTSLYPVRLDPGALDLEEALSGGRCARPGAEDHQGAVARGAGQGARLWAAALSQRRDGGGAGRAACAAAWLQLSGPVCRRRRRRGLWAPAGRGRWLRGLAAAIRRCRWRM